MLADAARITRTSKAASVHCRRAAIEVPVKDVSKPLGRVWIRPLDLLRFFSRRSTLAAPEFRAEAMMTISSSRGGAAFTVFRTKAADA